MTPSQDNLEWLAFSRGTRAFSEWLKLELPWLDSDLLYKKYATETFAMDEDFREWQGRDYVAVMRDNATKEL